MSCFKQWLVMLTKIKIKFVICELFTVPKSCEFVFSLKKRFISFVFGDRVYEYFE